eukprot:897950-Pyramimonas_sp.AAC.1
MVTPVTTDAEAATPMSSTLGSYALLRTLTRSYARDPALLRTLTRSYARDPALLRDLTRSYALRGVR